MPDVLVVTADAMDRLAERGTIDTSSRIDLVPSRIGIAVPRRAAHPDIGTLDAAIQTLRAARSVGYSRGGASGIHFAAAIERLGIAAEINARATIIPAGFTAEQLIIGEADIAVQQVSELMTVPGVEIVGSLPEPLGTAAIFSGAVFAGTAQPEAARRLLALLDDPGTRQALRAGGARTALARALRRGRPRSAARPHVPGRQTRKQILDLAPRRGTQPGARVALGVGRDQATPRHHVFPHREPNARLLLVAQQRQVGIEQVVRRVAVSPPPACGPRPPACRGRRSRSSHRRRHARFRNRGRGPPLPHRIEIGRPPACSVARSALIFSRPGQSSCLSITQCAFSSTMRRITPGDITTEKLSG